MYFFFVDAFMSSFQAYDGVPQEKQATLRDLWIDLLQRKTRVVLGRECAVSYTFSIVHARRPHNSWGTWRRRFCLCTRRRRQTICYNKLPFQLFRCRAVSPRRVASVEHWKKFSSCLSFYCPNWSFENALSLIFCYNEWPSISLISAWFWLMQRLSKIRLGIKSPTQDAFFMKYFTCFRPWTFQNIALRCANAYETPPCIRCRWSPKSSVKRLSLGKTMGCLCSKLKSLHWSLPCTLTTLWSSRIMSVLYGFSLSFIHGATFSNLFCACFISTNSALSNSLL